MANYEYAADLVRVVDGDTVWLTLRKSFTFPVDFGFGILDSVQLAKTATVDFRLYGINTPETHGPTRESGLRSSAELTRVLKSGTIRVVSYKPDKYGRYLADIYVMQPDGTELWVNRHMLDGGFATPYFGEGPKT